MKDRSWSKPRVVLMCCKLRNVCCQTKAPYLASLWRRKILPLRRRRRHATRIPNFGKDGTPVRAHFGKTFPAAAEQDPPLRLKSGPRRAAEKLEKKNTPTSSRAALWWWRRLFHSATWPRGGARVLFTQIRLDYEGCLYIVLYVESTKIEL